MTKKLLMGNEAIAHAALEAGVRVVAGYPGTPSSEIVETVAKLHAAGQAKGVHVEWSTNEKAALELLIGASYAGARGLFTCKQMGLNVASDALMSVNYVGIKGGLVLLVADDPGPISSQTEQDTRRFAAFAKLPVLDPATPEQAFLMTKAAFDLSERYGTPVIVRPTTRIDHASTFFDVQNVTQAQDISSEGFVRNPAKWIIFPKRSFEAHGEINSRLVAMAHAFSSEDTWCFFNPIYTNGLIETDSHALPKADLGIVAGGVSAAYVHEALSCLENRAKKAGVTVPAYRFMQVGTAYPFPEERASYFSEGLSKILVLEELDYVLEDAFTLLAGRSHASFEVRGKLTKDACDRGENNVDDITERIARFLGLDALRVVPGNFDQPCNLLVRPPVLCAGCPHRGAFFAIKKALGNTPAVLCGDIGCYTLGNAQPLDAVDTCLCMGAGITMAQGFSVVEPHKKAVAYVGDSTFFASGMTGIANAAYNGHDITVVILDNATTAMTGAQPHPGTGVTLMGSKSQPISIEAVLRANNFSCIVHADPLDYKAATHAAHEALEFEGPSAVIYESPCIQLIKPRTPVFIDTQLCTGCKRCITSIGCPGIGFDLKAEGPASKDRGQAVVNPALCNGCGLCLQLCPFEAITQPAEEGFMTAQTAAMGTSPQAEVTHDPVTGGAHA